MGHYRYKTVFVADWVRNTIRERKVEDRPSKRVVLGDQDHYHSFEFSSYMEALEWILHKHKERCNRLKKEYENAVKRFEQVLEGSAFGDQVLPLCVYRGDGELISQTPVFIDRKRMIQIHHGECDHVAHSL